MGVMVLVRRHMVEEVCFDDMRWDEIELDNRYIDEYCIDPTREITVLQQRDKE